MYSYLEFDADFFETYEEDYLSEEDYDEEYAAYAEESEADEY